MRGRLFGLGAGIAFGALLDWGGLADPEVIEDMLLLRSFDLFLLMISAIVVASIGARVLRLVGVRSIVDGTPIEWTMTRPTTSHFAGSAVFGVGWAVSLTCPGPLAAQIGSGNLAAVATALGVLGGVFVAGRWRARAPAVTVVAAPTVAPIGL